MNLIKRLRTRTQPPTPTEHDLFGMLTEREVREYWGLAWSEVFGPIATATTERLNVLELLAKARWRERGNE